MNNIQQGEALKEEGMRRAVDHADREVLSWSERAYAAVKIFAIKGLPFTTEEIARWAYSHGLPVPPDPRAWGSVMRSAVLAGLVEASHYEKSQNPKAHRRPVQVWQSKRSRNA
jgi:hypothetical protein